MQRPPGEDGVVGIANLPGPTTVDFVTRTRSFFGRDAELEALLSAVPSARPGRPLVRFVVGSSGVGKSALLQRAARRLTASGALVLGGRCSRQDSGSYRALAGVLEGLAQHLISLPAGAVEALTPSDAGLMGRSFPVLLRAAQFARAEAPTEPLLPLAQRNRAFLGLRQLMSRLCAERAVVILLDDMHWVDPDSLALLSTLLVGPTAPPLALLGSLSPEGELGLQEQVVAASQLQRVLMTSGEPLLLGGLPHDAARTFAASLLAVDGVEDQEAAASIAREAGGHPRLIEEWVLLFRESSERAHGTSLGDIVRERLQQLRPEALVLATLLALSDGPVPLEVLAHARSASSEEVKREAAALRLSRLCRGSDTSAGETLALAHDRVRDAILGTLVHEANQRHHAALARAYEVACPRHEEALARHLELAGNTRRAAEVFASAADRALDVLAFARATRLYRRSIALGGAHTTPELYARLGDALTSWGRAAEGGRAYLAAAANAEPTAALELKRRATEQLLVCGDQELAHRAATELRSQLNLPIAGGSAMALMRSSLRWLRLRTTGIAFRKRDPSEVTRAELLRIDACWSLFVGFATLDPVRAQDPLSLHLLLSLKAGDPMRVARGLAGLAIVLEMARGQSARGQELIERAEALSEGLALPHVRGLCALHAGLRAFNAGHLDLAKMNLEQAEQVFQYGTSGAPWELSVTRFLSLLCHFVGGDVASLRRLANDWRDEAITREDQSASENLRVRVFPALLLLTGAPEAARGNAALPATRGPGARLSIQSYWREVSLIECDLFEGRSQSARQRMRALWPELVRSSLLSLRAVYLEAHWLCGRVLLSALAEGDASVSLSDVLNEALLVERSDIAGSRGIANTMRAALLARSGDLHGSSESFRFAEAALAESGRELLAKLALLSRGLLDLGPDSERARRDAEQWLSGAGIRDTRAVLRMLMPGGLARASQP